MTSLIRSGVTETLARAYRGRWIADCLMCHNAIPAKDCNVFVCGECGLTSEIVWPSDDMKAGVERLLGMRPHVATQNWFPGETLEDLLWENAAHGVFSQLTSADSLTCEFGVTPDRVDVDRLPQLVGASRKAVSS